MNILPMQRVVAVLLIAVTIASCAKSSDTTSANNNNNNGNGTTAPQDTMIATIDGTTYKWHAAGTKTGSGPYTITVAGADSTGKGSGFNLMNVPGTGTYTVGGSSSLLVTVSYQYKDGSGNDVGYAASGIPGLISGSGTVTVTQITPRLIATFNGTLQKIKGTSGASSVTVTNASVNATYY